MRQSVHAFLNLQKSSKIGQFPHAAFDHRADAVALRHGGPGVGFELFDAERNPALSRLHFEHHRFHLVAGLHEFARVLHAAAPGHLGDMDEPLDSRLDLDKRAVIGDAHHSADDAVTPRITLDQRGPGVRCELANP